MTNTSDWISTKSELPEPNINVLFIYHGQVMLGTFYRCAARFVTEDAAYYLEGVTHWMPSPEPTSESKIQQEAQ